MGLGESITGLQSKAEENTQQLQKVIGGIHEEGQAQSMTEITQRKGSQMEMSDGFVEDDEEEKVPLRDDALLEDDEDIG